MPEGFGGFVERKKKKTKDFGRREVQQISRPWRIPRSTEPLDAAAGFFENDPHVLYFGRKFVSDRGRRSFWHVIAPNSRGKIPECREYLDAAADADAPTANGAG